jgi:hypothetical protein
MIWFDVRKHPFLKEASAGQSREHRPDLSLSCKWFVVGHPSLDLGNLLRRQLNVGNMPAKMPVHYPVSATRLSWSTAAAPQI